MHCKFNSRVKSFGLYHFNRFATFDDGRRQLVESALILWLSPPLPQNAAADDSVVQIAGGGTNAIFASDIACAAAAIGNHAGNLGYIGRGR